MPPRSRTSKTRGADLGLAPSNDGKVTGLPTPPMSGEQRTKMTKLIKERAENAKVSCRNIRRDGNKHLETAEKEKTMTEDDRDKGIEEIQKMLKSYEGQIDTTAATKTKEVLEQ